MDMLTQRAMLLTGLAGMLIECGGAPVGPDIVSLDTAGRIVQVDDTFPRLQGTAADGSVVDSREWRGRVQVVFFWALYCKTCLGGAGDLLDLQHMQSSFGRERMNAIAINPIDDRGEVREIQTACQYTYPFIADEGRALWRRYGQLDLPSVYVVDGDGVVRYRAAGFDAFAVADVVRALQR